MQDGFEFVGMSLVVTVAAFVALVSFGVLMQIAYELILFGMGLGKRLMSYMADPE
jgi:hypothetical protein